MLIKEIFEPEEQDVQLSKPFDIAKFNRQREKKFFSDAPLTSGGMYATGIPSQTDPSEFVKMSNSPTILDQDAFYRYVQTIKSSIGSNPYFPYIRKVVVGKDPTGMAKTYYKMPKLFNYKDPEINIDMLQAMAEKTFKLSASLFNTRVWQQSNQYLTKNEVKEKIWREVIITNLSQLFHSILDRYDQEYKLNSYLWRRNKKQTNQTADIDTAKKLFDMQFNTWFINMIAKVDWPTDDSYLVQAIAIIATLMRTQDFQLDITADNVMIRLTAQGPQLVLNDPIHDNLRSIIK